MNELFEMFDYEMAQSCSEFDDCCSDLMFEMVMNDNFVVTEAQVGNLADKALNFVRSFKDKVVKLSTAIINKIDNSVGKFFRSKLAAIKEKISGVKDKIEVVRVEKIVKVYDAAIKKLKARADKIKATVTRNKGDIADSDTFTEAADGNGVMEDFKDAIGKASEAVAMAPKAAAAYTTEAVTNAKQKIGQIRDNAIDAIDRAAAGINNMKNIVAPKAIQAMQKISATIHKMTSIAMRAVVEGLKKSAKTVVDIVGSLAVGLAANKVVKIGVDKIYRHQLKKELSKKSPEDFYADDEDGRIVI